jgi:hypothetical protein
MPLSRLNDGFEIELEGIAFGMVDRQGHRWRCPITDRVLSEEQLMPLSRLNDGFEIELEGIAFGMVDSRRQNGRGVTALGAQRADAHLSGARRLHLSAIA